MNRSRLNSILKAVPSAESTATVGLAALLILVPVALVSARDRARQDVFSWTEREKGAQSIWLDTEPFLLEVGASFSPDELEAALRTHGFGEELTRTRRGVLIELPPRLQDGGCVTSSIEVEIERGRIAALSEGGIEIESLLLPSVPFDRADPDRDQLRIFTPLSRIPDPLIAAVLAAEDRRFFAHGGIDLLAMTRAALANARAGDAVQGGSTISQQLAKNLFLASDRTVERKLREVFLAVALEEALTKRGLLESYLNEIHFGRVAHRSVIGVGAAALAYFGRPVECLGPAEGAVLAGIIRAPNRLSPARHPERALRRAAQVLRSDEELDDADLDEVVFAPATVTRRAPYFADFVREELARLGAGGTRAISTLDLEIQHLAERALEEGLAVLDEKSKAPLEGAIVVLETKTGRIRAMVGGRDYQRSRFNRAAHAHRQVGSIAKPIVALAALRGEYADTSTLLEDEPIVLETKEGPWSPQNVDHVFRGPITLHAALARSVNIPFVRLSQQIGLLELGALLDELELHDEGSIYPSLALGAFEATPLEVAAAFASIAAGGTFHAPYAVERILAGDGEPVFEHRPEERTIASPEAAYQVFDMMRAAVNHGTAYRVRALRYRYDVAGKTGTTDDTRDGWFVGIDPELVTVVWIGADSPAPTGLLAGDAAVPIWTRVMRAVRNGRPPPAHSPPPSLRRVQLCDESGKLAGTFCPHVSQVVVKRSTELEHCDTFEHITGIACVDGDGNEACTFVIDESDGEEVELQRDDH